MRRIAVDTTSVTGDAWDGAGMLEKDGKSGENLGIMIDRYMKMIENDVVYS